MSLLERLNELMEKGQPIGFSPWRDAEGVLWGVIIRITKREITLQQISPHGQQDGEEVFRISSISYFDDDPTYAERLLQLTDFRPTKPDTSKYTRSRSLIRNAIRAASSSGEVLNVRLLSEEITRIVTVAWHDKTWVEFIIYDDLMNVLRRMIWRVSAVLEVRQGTASEEADEYLLARANSSFP